jgi:hypothetical protein
MNRTQIGSAFISIMVGFFAWTQLCSGSSALLRMGKTYDGIFIGNNSVHDWLPVLAATAFAFGLLLQLATDLALKKDRRYVAISFTGLFFLIIIGIAAAHFVTDSFLLQDSLMLFMPLYAAGWFFSATIAIANKRVWREKLWKR